MKSFGAVHLLAAVVALVVGLVVGGIGPRGELRQVQQKLEAMEEKPCTGRTGADIAKIFQGRPWEEGDAPAPRVQPPAVPEQANAATDSPEEDKGGFNISFGGDDKSEDPENIEEAMDLARDALDIRHQQAMAALEQDAKPTPEQMESIEATFDKMNEELIGLAEELRDQVQTGEEPSRRDAMLYAAETLDVFLSAEDNLRGTLTDEQVGSMQDESLDPLSYVDPALIDVLQDLNR